MRLMEMLLPYVKLCCIRDDTDLQAAIDAGPDAIGFVGRHLSGPEVIESDHEIGRLARQIPHHIAKVLLLRDTDAAVIIERTKTSQCNTLQLITPPTPLALAQVRNALPDVKCWLVVHVISTEAMTFASQLDAYADALVLDSGSPTAGVYGGTGAAHDWSISASIVRHAKHPVYLAGGLRTDLLDEAWRRVGPAGFDVCSGIRTQGVLDAAKAAAFVRKVRALSAT